MLNTSDILRGLTDTLILAQLIPQDSYDYELNKNISTKSDGLLEFKEATLYTSFRRLEENNCISSYWGDEQSGARRRYYSITPAGKKLYEENAKDWQKIKYLIDQFISQPAEN